LGIRHSSSNASGAGVVEPSHAKAHDAIDDIDVCIVFFALVLGIEKQKCLFLD
jgi:hypothetical protein